MPYLPLNELKNKALINMKFNARNLLVILIIFNAFLTFTGAFFIVNETKQALVLQFGDPRKLLPNQDTVQNTFYSRRVFIDSRLLNLDPQPEEMILSGPKKNYS